MARWSDRFQPITLSRDERIIIFKRESLRLRGLTWSLLIFAALSSVMFWLCIPIVRNGWQDEAQALVNGLLLLIAVAALPAFLLLVSTWLEGTYELSPQRLCQKAGFVAEWGERMRRLQRPVDKGATPAAPTSVNSIECLHVWRASVEWPRGPARWFGIGDVVVSSRARARALVIPSVAHPDSIAEEITRYGQQAGVKDSQLPTRRYRRSFSWLLFMVSPGLIFLWACVALWIGLRLTQAMGLQTAQALAGYLDVLLIPLLGWGIASFLQWWYCAYLVTERRVASRQGIFKVTEINLRLEEVVSVSVTKEGLARYLDVGHVQVNTAGHSGSVRMVNISEPDYVRRRILDLQEQLRQQRLQLEFGEIRERLVRALRL